MNFEKGGYQILQEVLQAHTHMCPNTHSGQGTTHIVDKEKWRQECYSDTAANRKLPLTSVNLG